MSTDATGGSRRWRTLLRRWFVRVAVGMLVVFAGGALYVSRSLPQTEGEVTVPGLSGRVEIVRDAYGVPHVFASTEPDAYFALGYVHAQERLWQMELHRRLGAGRLSEIFGETTLEQDRLLRTLGLMRAAAADALTLTPSARGIAEAYVRGVNAWLAEGHVLPPEFLLFRVTPETWTVADCVLWLKVMALGLAGNFQQELARVALTQKLAPGQLSEFLAPYPGDPPIVLPDMRALYGSLARPARELLARLPRHDDIAMGSNNWVVDGKRTESGKPLLANDPHLEMSAPATWFLAHLSAPGLDVVGATLPGVPAVILGRNERVAWTFTNTESDVQDLYVEKLVPGDPSSYVTPEGPAPFSTREERVKVRGAEDVVLTVRTSRHGPVVSDASELARKGLAEGHVIALRWTALEPGDTTLEFPIAAARARDANELLAATKLFVSPEQNIVYADVDGAVGFIAAGRVPIRRPDNELRGLMPSPGWLERYDWTGFVPWEELPQARNPTSGVIVTANQKITPDGYPYSVSLEWDEPWRADRIRALLDAREKHTAESFAQIQLDVRSGTAEALLPLLLAKATLEDADDGSLLERLRQWNREMRRDTPEPLLFSAWVREVARGVYGDELGDLFPDFWSERVRFLVNVLSADDGASRWCDDVRTAERETCDVVVGRALHAAIAYLKASYGADPHRWTWGEAHPMRSSHPILGDVPILGSLFNIELPAGGDNETVNLAGYAIGDVSSPFVARSGPALRAIYDLGDLEKSRFVISTGQSGNPLSSHYRDQARLWSDGVQIPMRTRRDVLEQVQKLVLVPSAEPARASR